MKQNLCYNHTVLQQTLPTRGHFHILIANRANKGNITNSSKYKMLLNMIIAMEPIGFTLLPKID